MTMGIIRAFNGGATESTCEGADSTGDQRHGCACSSREDHRRHGKDGGSERGA